MCLMIVEVLSRCLKAPLLLEGEVLAVVEA